MRKLDRLILKSFLGPLLLTFAIAVFVLLMQFVWKYIDDLVGKGLDFGVIAQLMLYASATFVPMALPIAVLFASIMTMGNFGEHYELVAMKAGGVSVRRIMMPMAVVALMLSGVAFYFNNNVLPRATYNYRTLLYDVQRKKPAVSIRPSTYYSEIDGYVIRINQKDPDGQTMHDILIYDHTQGINNTNIIVADHGRMQTTPDNHYLLFTLYDGYTYSEPEEYNYLTPRPFTSIGFDEQVLTFDISSFAFSKSQDDFFDNHYQMKNVAQLSHTVDSLWIQLDGRYQELNKSLASHIRVYNDSLFHPVTSTDSLHQVLDPQQWLTDSTQPRRYEVLNTARNFAQASRNDASMFSQIIKSEKEYINLNYIEWMRKFTLATACLLLFLIGAPFGSIVRKGGLGMPLVASVVFFVLYYVVGMISEKSVRESALGPIGMWMSTFVFIPLGIVLTWSATTDSSLFDLATWKKILGIKRSLKRKKQK